LYTTLNTAIKIALALYPVLPLSLLKSHPDMLCSGNRDTTRHLETEHPARAYESAVKGINLRNYPSPSVGARTSRTLSDGDGVAGGSPPVMLSGAKHLSAHGDRPFASLRVTVEGPIS